MYITILWCILDYFSKLIKLISQSEIGMVTNPVEAVKVIDTVSFVISYNPLYRFSGSKQSVSIFFLR